jgi:hypothetical protein
MTLFPNRWMPCAVAHLVPSGNWIDLPPLPDIPGLVQGALTESRRNCVA